MNPLDVNQKKNRYFFALVAVFATGFFLSARAALGEAVKTNSEDAAALETQVDPVPDFQSRPVSEDEMLRMNRNLKNVIAENHKLWEDRKSLEEHSKLLSGQLEIEHNAANLLAVQRDALEEKGRQVEESNKKIQQELQEVQKDSSGILARLDGLSQQNKQLKDDAARAHYKMGNMFFQKREYEKARDQYQQALTLLPADAAAHFNLAFVSGEYLKDPRTAQEHYQKYLDLNPKAEDAPLVKKRILVHQLELRHREKHN